MTSTETGPVQAPQVGDIITTDLGAVARVLADEMGCSRVPDDGMHVNYCGVHSVGWLSDTDMCARAERLASVVLARLTGGTS